MVVDRSESLVSSYQKSCGDKFGSVPQRVQIMVTLMAAMVQTRTRAGRQLVC